MQLRATVEQQSGGDADTSSLDFRRIYFDNVTVATSPAESAHPMAAKGLEPRCWNKATTWTKLRLDGRWRSRCAPL
eukprot:4155371-Prymnesium_polylepis.1